VKTIAREKNQHECAAIKNSHEEALKAFHFFVAMLNSSVMFMEFLMNFQLFGIVKEATCNYLRTSPA
jgi:hypothetical protein